MTDKDRFNLYFERWMNLMRDQFDDEDKLVAYCWTQAKKLAYIMSVKYPRGLSVHQAIVAGIL